MQSYIWDIAVASWRRGIATVRRGELTCGVMAVRSNAAGAEDHCTLFSLGRHPGVRCIEGEASRPVRDAEFFALPLLCGSELSPELHMAWLQPFLLATVPPSSRSFRNFARGKGLSYASHLNRSGQQRTHKLRCLQRFLVCSREGAEFEAPPRPVAAPDSSEQITPHRSSPHASSPPQHHM